MRVVGYVRVSTSEQAEHGLGLAAQERAIREWCKSATVPSEDRVVTRQGHGGTRVLPSPEPVRLTHVYRDEGVSGANGWKDRKELPSALYAIQDGQADGIVVARLDRLARAITVQEAILAQVWEWGGKLFSVDMHGEVSRDDPDDPMRTAMRQMAGVFAELDKAMVVKRLRDGRAAKASAGRHATGQYPFGYVGRGKGRERDAAPDEAEQRAVRRIVELRQTGATYREIAVMLDAEGLPPRRAESWSAMAVRNVAMREGA